MADPGAELFVRRTRLSHPAEKVYAWHMRPGAFQRLSPPWAPMRIEGASEPPGEGSRVTLRGRGLLGLRWVAEHSGLVPGRRFQDVQVRGPFALWEHVHAFEPDGSGASVLEDRVRYRLPFGRLGAAVAGRLVRRKIERVFDYRHGLTAADLRRHEESKERTDMKIAVTGASGLVGGNLCAFLETGGHEVVRLVRRPARGPGEASWDPAAGTVDAQALAGVEGVVHLAGESIAARRWSEAQKKRIQESRWKGTELVARTLAGLDPKPRVLVCASAVGYYGDRGDEVLTEESAQGPGFLPETCAGWETAADPAREAGIRVVHVRIGIVLSPEGGALAKMLTPFKLGAGGVVGNGRQYMSWITPDDLVAVFHRALTDEGLVGPVNGVAPQSVTNREFTKTLGRVLGRPTVAPLPGFAVKVLFGEMGEELLLGSTRAVPGVLEKAGFRFEHPALEGALRHVLGRPA